MAMPLQEWVDEGCEHKEIHTSFDSILVPLSTCDPRQHAVKDNSIRVYPWFPTPDPYPGTQTDAPSHGHRDCGITMQRRA